MTGSARRRRSGMALAALTLGVALPLAAISPTAHGATPAVTVSVNAVLGLDKPTATSTCAGNSGGHGNGNNCDKGTATPTPTGTSGTVTGTGSSAGATAGTGTGSGTTGGDGTQGGTVSGSAGAGAGAASGAGGGGSTGRAGGSGGAGATGGLDGGVGLPTPAPAKASATVPGTSLPLWPILWTGTAVITLVTVAALLFLRDKRGRADGADGSAEASADPGDTTEGDGQAAEQAVPSPRGPIKMDWTESPG